MRAYEFTTVFRVKEDGYANGLKAVKAILAEGGAAITTEEDGGDRPLAYLVRKEERGHYHFFDIEMDPTAMGKAENALKLETNLLKYLFVKKES